MNVALPLLVFCSIHKPLSTSNCSAFRIRKESSNFCFAWIKKQSALCTRTPNSKTKAQCSSTEVRLLTIMWKPAQTAGSHLGWFSRSSADYDMKEHILHVHPTANRTLGQIKFPHNCRQHTSKKNLAKVKHISVWYLKRVNLASILLMVICDNDSGWNSEYLDVALKRCAESYFLSSQALVGRLSLSLKSSSRFSLPAHLRWRMIQNKGRSWNRMLWCCKSGLFALLACLSYFPELSCSVGHLSIFNSLPMRRV